MSQSLKSNASIPNWPRTVKFCINNLSHDIMLLGSEHFLKVLRGLYLWLVLLQRPGPALIDPSGLQNRSLRSLVISEIDGRLTETSSCACVTPLSNTR